MTPLTDSQADPREALRKEICEIMIGGAFDDGLDEEGQQLLLALIDRERKKAVQESFDRLAGSPHNDWTEDQAKVLSDMFPPQP